MESIRGNSIDHIDCIDYIEYIDQVSKEPLLQPYTLLCGLHKETYNESTWRGFQTQRIHKSPLLKQPIYSYTQQGKRFNPVANEELKHNVEKWLLTTKGRAYLED
jgi:hypothetical protein